MEQLIGRLEDFPEGKPWRFDTGRFSLCLVRRGERVFALYDQCPHRQANLSAGTVGGTAVPSEVGVFEYGRDGEILRCPWHGWEFDVRTGQSYCEPERIQVRSYPVEVAEGQRVVQGPYVAETVPVTVEEQYVVVDV
jgi:3-phenylpropionate/trans-cinnamate dioxygenase ferredoxin subunit